MLSIVFSDLNRFRAKAYIDSGFDNVITYEKKIHWYKTYETGLYVLKIYSKLEYMSSQMQCALDVSVIVWKTKNKKTDVHPKAFEW